MTTYCTRRAELVRKAKSAAAQQVRLQQAQALEQARTREADFHAQLAPLLPLAERGNVDAMRQAAAMLCAHHRITVDERSANDLHARGVSAYARWGSREIVVPPIIDADTFAVRLHEAAHILCGPCGGGDHQPDPNVTRWTHCLKCEVAAWDRALTLARFSWPMFKKLQRSLLTYRQTTGGPRTAIAALDKTTSVQTYIAVKQFHMRLAWLERVKQEVGYGQTKGRMQR